MAATFSCCCDSGSTQSEGFEAEGIGGLSTKISDVEGQGVVQVVPAVLDFPIEPSPVGGDALQQADVPQASSQIQTTSARQEPDRCNSFQHLETAIESRSIAHDVSEIVVKFGSGRLGERAKTNNGETSAANCSWTTSNGWSVTGSDIAGMKRTSMKEHARKMRAKAFLEVSTSTILRIERASLFMFFLLIAVATLITSLNAAIGRELDAASASIGVILTMSYAQTAVAAAIARCCHRGWRAFLIVTISLLWLLPTVSQFLATPKEVPSTFGFIAGVSWFVSSWLLSARRLSNSKLVLVHTLLSVLSFVGSIGFITREYYTAALMYQLCDNPSTCAISTANDAQGMQAAHIFAFMNESNFTEVMLNTTSFGNSTLSVEANSTDSINASDGIDIFKVYADEDHYLARIKTHMFFMSLGEGRNFYFQILALVAASPEFYHVEFCELHEEEIEVLHMRWLQKSKILLSGLCTVFLGITWVTKYTAFAKVLIVVLALHQSNAAALSMSGREVDVDEGIPRRPMPPHMKYRQAQIIVSMMGIFVGPLGAYVWDLDPLKAVSMSFPMALFCSTVARLVYHERVALCANAFFLCLGVASCSLGHYEHALHAVCTVMFLIVGSYICKTLPCSKVQNKVKYLRRAMVLTMISFMITVKMLSSAFYRRQYHNLLCANHGSWDDCRVDAATPPIYDDSVDTPLLQRLDMRPVIYAEYMLSTVNIHSEGVVFVAYTFTMILPSYWVHALRVHFVHLVWLRQLSRILILHLACVATLSITTCFTEVLDTPGSRRAFFILVICCSVTVAMIMAEYHIKAMYGIEFGPILKSSDLGTMTKTTCTTSTSPSEAQEPPKTISNGERPLPPSPASTNSSKGTSPKRSASSPRTSHKTSQLHGHFNQFEGISLLFRKCLMMLAVSIDVALLVLLTWVRARNPSPGLTALREIGYDFFAATVYTLHFQLLAVQTAKALRFHRTCARCGAVFIWIWVFVRVGICMATGYIIEGTGDGYPQPRSVLSFALAFSVALVEGLICFHMWRDLYLDRRKHIGRLMMLTVPVTGALVRYTAIQSKMNDWYFERLRFCDPNDDCMLYWGKRVTTPEGAFTWEDLVSNAKAGNLAARLMIVMLFLVTLPSYWCQRTHTSVLRITNGDLSFREKVNMIVFAFLAFNSLLDVAIDHEYSTFVWTVIIVMHGITLSWMLSGHNDDKISPLYHNTDVVGESAAMAFTAMLSDLDPHGQEKEAQNEAAQVVAVEDTMEGVLEGVGEL